MGETGVAYGSIYENKLSGWARFMGILSIIGGSLTCLGIFTAVVGVPVIIAGVKLLNAVKKLEIFSQQKDDSMLREGMKDLNTYFLINGILAIIGISFTVLYIIIIIAVIAAGGFKFPNKF